MNAIWLLKPTDESMLLGATGGPASGTALLKGQLEIPSRGREVWIWLREGSLEEQESHHEIAIAKIAGTSGYGPLGPA